MKYKHHVGFIIFLLIYSYMKYAVAFELMTQLNFVISTAIMIILTAVIPYGASYLIQKKLHGSARYGAALLLPLVLGALGLATYFFVFIAPSGSPVTLDKVLPRSITPGIIMGVILLGSTLMFKRDAKSKA